MPTDEQLWERVEAEGLSWHRLNRHRLELRAVELRAADGSLVASVWLLADGSTRWGWRVESSPGWQAAAGDAGTTTSARRAACELVLRRLGLLEPADDVDRAEPFRERLERWVERAGWTEAWVGRNRDRFEVAEEGEVLATVERASPAARGWKANVRCGRGMPWTRVGARVALPDAVALARSVALLDRCVHVQDGWWVNLDPQRGPAEVRVGEKAVCAMAEVDGCWGVGLEGAAPVEAWSRRADALAHLAVMACELAFGRVDEVVDLEQLARTRLALSRLPD